MLMRVSRFLFLGLGIGYIFALILSQWLWLAMRINTSLLITVFACLGVLVALLTKRSLPKGYFLGVELLIPPLFLLLYRDVAALTVMPAVLFREAVNLNSLSLLKGNMIVIFLLVLANICWFGPKKQS